MRHATDADEAFAYLKATNAGTTPDDVLRVLADGMTKADDYIRHLISSVEGAYIATNEYASKPGGNYPFPGWQTFSHQTQVEFKEGFEPDKFFPYLRPRVHRPSSRGRQMFWDISKNMERRGIEVRLNTPAVRLIRSAENEVHGMIVRGPRGESRICGRRAVILACGGFEFDETMKRQFLEGKPVLTASNRGNTGDGIRMAQSMGAELWHMWHVHGCYGFKHPDPEFPFALRAKRLPDWNPAKKEEQGNVAMVWIVVDQNGRRYMNEYPPYVQDTGHRAMHYMDTETMSYPRIPSWLITDWKGCSTYQLCDIRTNDREYVYDCSPDNSKEIALGILKKAETIVELANEIGADPATLQTTIDRWNDQCHRGEDSDFGRPPGTMCRIENPPFVFGAVYPIISNTQGGPVHSARQEVMNVDGRPILRLYTAGELGSSFGHLYLSGGNIAECFVTGWVAGREAAGQRPWCAD